MTRDDYLWKTDGLLLLVKRGSALWESEKSAVTLSGMRMTADSDNRKSRTFWNVKLALTDVSEGDLGDVRRLLEGRSALFSGEMGCSSYKKKMYFTMHLRDALDPGSLEVLYHDSKWVD